MAEFGTLAAQTNCPGDVGMRHKDEKLDVKCPECGQFHLRPGYCQARNLAVSEAIGAGRRVSLDDARRLARGEDVFGILKPKDETAVTLTPVDVTLREKVSVTNARLSR